MCPYCKFLVDNINIIFTDKDSVAKSPEASIAVLESYLCEIIDKEGLHIYDVVSNGFQEWYREHLNKRIQWEQKIKKENQFKSLKETALSKLTDEERKALNV